MNGIKINFDVCHNPEEPTIVIAKKNGDKINGIRARNITVHGNLNSPSELAFNIYKDLDSISDEMWDEITDFRLVWCKEWNKWFEARVELSESDKLIKTVTCVGLGEAELSQIMLYEIEINTESDISRDDYLPTKLYWAEKPQASLLHRLLEKAPHYTIAHVDYTLMSIQRSYTFDGVSVYDAFNSIAEEINALFVFDVQTDESGNIKRVISVYDLESYCNHCGNRGIFDGDCPSCGSGDIHSGYGEDTTVFVSAEQIAEKIQLTTDNKAVKNCFKLEAGDDLMTATIRRCNPNGTDYLWYISDTQKKDMSAELVDKIERYDAEYENYRSQKKFTLNSTLVSQYNSLVSKYASGNLSLSQIVNPVTGYASLIGIYYDTIDFALYLESSLMPTVEAAATNATKEVALLTSDNMSPVAVTNLPSITINSANSAILSLAKSIVNPKYQVKIVSSSLSKTVWTGKFSVTNYGNEEDTAQSGTVTITINSDYKTFVEQKIEKTLHDKSDDELSITGLFKMQLSDFKQELKKYSLNYLNLFLDCCQSCIDILIEQGVANKDTWDSYSQNLYSSVYTPYYDKMGAIQDELLVRQNEIEVITGRTGENGTVIKNGIQTSVVDTIATIQRLLNFETYLGKTLWTEFSTFRREDKFSNPNYISDGLDNKELLENAEDFIRAATKELYKSAEMQRSISVSMKNVFMVNGFEPLLDHFEVGNWIRVLIDEKVYKLRIVDFEVDYDNLQNISVSFSDVINDGQGGYSDIQSILSQASTMASSYDFVKRQSEKGKNSNNILENWFESGMDATNVKIMSNADYQEQVWDSHGMLFRKYNPILDNYDGTQLKIINSTLAITTDNWRTTKTAIGKFLYREPTTGELIESYGVNAEAVVGKFIIGENLSIYNHNLTMKVDENGLYMTNGKNAISINPEADSLFSIINASGENVIGLDSDGNANFKGRVTATSLSTGAKTSKDAKGGGVFIDCNGNFYAGLNNEVQILANGTSTFKGGINATHLSTGAKTSKDSTGTGVFIDSNGNFYAGSKNQVRIFADGTLNIGNGKMSYDGTNLVLSDYSNTKDMNSTITQTADGIRTEVTQKTNAVDTNAKKYADDAEKNAKSDTAEKLKSYSTTIEMNSAISQTAGEIRSDVSETYSTHGYVDEKISVIQQNADKISLSVGNIDSKLDKLGGDFGTLNSELDDRITKQTNVVLESDEFKISMDTIVGDSISKNSSIKSMSGDVNRISSYFKFTQDGLEIGKDGNKIVLRQTNDRIEFVDTSTGNAVAYLSDSKLYITDGFFINELRIGKFAFVPRPETGNMSLIKVG